MKPGNGLRAAVYHRFHCLLPLVAHPFARRALRFVAWVCVAAYFALVAAILALRYVVLPQAFKRVLPPLAGQFISLVKDTSLVSVIAITELLKSGREVITTSFSPFEILFCVAGLYLLINLPLSHFASRLERRLAQSD